jgi:hypothetical protein
LGTEWDIAHRACYPVLHGLIGVRDLAMFSIVNDGASADTSLVELQMRNFEVGPIEKGLLVACHVFSNLFDW